MSLSQQHSLPVSTALHLAPGLLILAVYLALAPYVIERGYPALYALIWAAGAGILLQASHLVWLGRTRNGAWSLEGVVVYRKRTPIGGSILLVLAVIAIAAAVVGLMAAIDARIQATLFWWLPDWFFFTNPNFLAEFPAEIAFQVALLRLIMDGLLLPIVEEFYFRGYLMPRLDRFGIWTPWVHHLLFTVYHFWQPHNYLTIYAAILPMVWVAWRKQNLYLSLAAHLLLNLLGAVAMLGVAGGVE